MKKEKRFEVLETEGSGLSMAETVLVDTKTGVNYLFVHSGYAGGLTVMVDAYGKPIVTRYIPDD